MSTSTKENYQKAIEKGKKKMQSSKDRLHDYTHAQNVDKISLLVYQELKEKKYHGIDAVTPGLVRITAWWHDCYKAEQEKFSITANFYEGHGSAKIINDQLEELLSFEELSMIAVAVENHAGSKLFPYFFLNKPQSPLHKILIEADAYELININRVKEGYKGTKSLKQKIWAIIDIFEPIMLPLYLRTKTTRKDLCRRLFNYWATWFWRDGYILKLMRP